MIAVFFSWMKSMLQRKEIRVVDEPTARGLSVTHTVKATIFRAPAFVVEDKVRGTYYTSKRVYVPGVIRETVFAVPSAENIDVARAKVAEKVGLRRKWVEVVQKPRALKEGLEVFPGDVVQYKEELV